MKRLRDRRSRRLAALIVVGLLAGMTGGTYAAFSSTTSNSGNSFGVKADYEAPTIVRSEIAVTTSPTGGTISQGSSYYVYAQVSDGGNPPAGIGTVTANVCNVTTTTCSAVALSAGSYTVSGSSYNYRSASKTANNPLSAGSKTYSVTAADTASPINSATGNYSVIVDNSNPAGADVQTQNLGSTAGLAQTGDKIIFTYTKAMSAASIKTGWDGTATTVSAVFANGGCGAYDTVTVTSVNLGSLCLSGDYINGNRTFANSSMVMSGGGTTVTITLGTNPGGTNTETVAGAMAWTPSASATDVTGLPCSATVVTETGSADIEF